MYERLDYSLRRWIALKLEEKDREIARLEALLAIFYEQQLADITRNGT